MLTRGAVAAGAGEVLTSPVQAMAWGLGRVAGLEHPDRWGGLVDLPPVLDDRAAGRLCGVLAGCGEDQVAIRGRGDHGAAAGPRRRCRRARGEPVDAGRHACWSPAGPGAIGGHVARWLAGRGAPRVVLASRSGPAAPGVGRAGRDLAAAGTGGRGGRLRRGAARAQVAGLLARIGGGRAAAGGGAAHRGAGAGHRARRIPPWRSWPRWPAAKVAGAAHLDELTADLDLERFVLFSSIAATWGSGAAAGVRRGQRVP